MMANAEEASGDASEVLQSRFGFEDFRPGQREIIDHLLAGRSAAAVFPTGSGKSLCYQIPALMLPGLTLVVSPLIALMKDQIDQLRARGIAAARMDSTLTADEARTVSGAVQNRELRLLYVAPERFNNERFRELIARVPVSLFAVDEAHCISEWGHNFRPDYLKLAGFAQACRAERILALTATATPRVLDDICQGFGIEPEAAVRTGFYRENLKLVVSPVTAEARDAALIERLRERAAGPSIVYVTLQRTAEEVARRITSAGQPARAYHAGMTNEDRTSVQDWFIGSDTASVVATIAFGMGIDKANIRYIYHYNLPKSLENYSQEIGRSGRDAHDATCELFVCPDDLNVLENFVYGDTPSADAVQSLLSEIFDLGEEFEVALQELANRHDVRPLVLRTLLTYLELDGYLREGTAFYSSYQFRPLTSSAEILSHFDGERREFIATLLRQAKQAKTWFHIDLEAAATNTNQPRDRYVRALDYLAQQGWLELKAEGVRNHFQRLRKPADLEDLAAALYARAIERERREIARLGQMLDLAAQDGCVPAYLSAHFGEVLAQPCGQCSWCLTGRPAQLLPRRRDEMDLAILPAAEAVRAEHPEALGDPRAMARWLCGLTSPRASRARLSSHALFGALGHVPFDEVLAAVEASTGVSAAAR